MDWITNELKRRPPANPDIVGCKAVRAAQAFHRSIPSYGETPLVELKDFSSFIGVGRLFVKDESHRFGINSFKGLGGAYAIGRYLAGRLGRDIGDITYGELVSDETRKRLGDITFVSTTDGNHGRGVAWTAAQLRQKCIIFMPKGSSQERLSNIRALGADATITDLNYDDTIRMTAELAEKNGWVIVQDKDWEGYTDIPLWIMQGYGVMALECAESFKQSGIQPTHVFVQAGVGSMAAAVIGLMADFFAQARPRIVLMESEKADCYYQTAAANDGSFHVVGGEMDTIMAGLACGEPTNLGWPIIRDYVDCFVALPDFVTASGMRILAAPSGSDVRIVSGESAAVGVGLAYCLMTDPAFAKLRNRIDLGPDSIVLCFSTEGDTDKENYRRIVWEGAWPTVRTERKQTK